MTFIEVILLSEFEVPRDILNPPCSPPSISDIPRQISGRQRSHTRHPQSSLREHFRHPRRSTSGYGCHDQEGLNPAQEEPEGRWGEHSLMLRQSSPTIRLPPPLPHSSQKRKRWTRHPDQPLWHFSEPGERLRRTGFRGSTPTNERRGSELSLMQDTHKTSISIFLSPPLPLSYCHSNAEGTSHPPRHQPPCRSCHGLPFFPSPLAMKKFARVIIFPIYC